MSRRFVPPAVDALGDGPRSDAARELAAVREAGFAEGRDHGLAEGRASGLRDGEAAAREIFQKELAEQQADFARRDSGMRVAEALHRLLAARDEDRRALEHAARATIAAALNTLFPTLLDVAAGREVAALLADTLAERAEENLTLRAHPDTIAAVQAEGLAAPDAARLTTLPDDAFAPGAATLSWTGGGVAFDPAALLDRVTALLCPRPTIEENVYP